MSADHDSAFAVISKIVVLALAWFGTIGLAQIQSLVAIVSGLAVGSYAAFNLYYLIRDKRKK